LATSVQKKASPTRRLAKPLGRPVASDADERRRRIIEVARRQFARSGYVGTTNREIADEAGITTGAIYHYFASKLDLYLAVFEETDRLILQRYSEVASASSLSFDQRVASLLEVSSQMNSEDETLAAFLTMASFEAHRNPELLKSYQSHDAKMVAFFEDLVDQGLIEGGFAPEVSRREVLDALRVLTLGLTWFAVRAHDPVAHRRATDATVKLLEGRLVAGTKKSRRRKI
jgi:AcrR family transcriptional regulator